MYFEILKTHILVHSKSNDTKIFWPKFDFPFLSVHIPNTKAKNQLVWYISRKNSYTIQDQSCTEDTYSECGVSDKAQLLYFLNKLHTLSQMGLFFRLSSLLFTVAVIDIFSTDTCSQGGVVHLDCMSPYSFDKALSTVWSYAGWKGMR